MDKQDLYALDDAIYKQIQIDRKNKEIENKAYFDGMEKGAEMMMKAVRDYLTNEWNKSEGLPKLTNSESARVCKENISFD